MTTQGLASVALRLLGIYWLVSALVRIPSVLMIYPASRVTVQGQPFSPLLFFVIQAGGVVFLLILGMVLLAATDRLTRLIFREPKNMGAAALSTYTFQAVAFSIAGVWFFISGISGLTSSFFMMSVSANSGSASSPLDMVSRSWESAITEVALSLLGLGLFLGASRLSKLWHRRSGLATSEHRA